MQSQTERPARVDMSGPEADQRGLLLEEVNFKWLLAGLGWWIDMSRFRSEAPYATRFLELARASDSIALRASAASLQQKNVMSCDWSEATMDT